MTRSTLRAGAFLAWMLVALGLVMRWWALRGLDGYGGILSPRAYAIGAVFGPVLVAICGAIAIGLHVIDLFVARRDRGA
jgi:hypothetical protein